MQPIYPPYSVAIPRSKAHKTNARPHPSQSSQIHNIQPSTSPVYPHETPSFTIAQSGPHPVFSSSSFASLILLARYGLPPRSGWLLSISCRWFFLTFAFVRPFSLFFPPLSALQSSSHHQDAGGNTYLNERINTASRLFILDSKPPL